MLSQTAIDYACRDADATRRLYLALEPRLREEGLWDTYETTMKTLPLILEMQKTGWRIDKGVCHTLLREFASERDGIVGEIEEMGFPGLNPLSGPQVGVVLFEELGMTPPALTKKTKQPSTNDKYLQALKGEHPVVERICDVRELTKLEAIVLGILEHVVDGDRLLPRLNPCGTPTGRLACRDPNLLAIPKHSKRGKKIRGAFLPPKGWELWSWDLSQAELRTLAIGSEDPALVQAFIDRRDIHEETAKRMFGKAYSRDKHRFAAKAVNFGIPMGMSAKGLTEQMHKGGLLDHTDEDSQSWLNRWDAAYPQARHWLDGQVASCRERGWVDCLGGRRRYLPGVRASSKVVRSRAERQAQSFPMQAGAQHIMHLWEAAVFDNVVSVGLAKPILQIHDDLVLTGDPALFEEMDGLMKELLPSGYNVPIETDGAGGETWGDL